VLHSGGASPSRQTGHYKSLSARQVSGHSALLLADKIILAQPGLNQRISFSVKAFDLAHPSGVSSPLVLHALHRISMLLHMMHTCQPLCFRLNFSAFVM